MASETGRTVTCYNQALQWIKNTTLPEKGIAVSSRNQLPYLEVTGYLIPTLQEAGELSLAEQYTEFLVYMQCPNGAYYGPDARQYPFDSGQALRGLLAAAGKGEHVLAAAARTADYLANCIDQQGRFPAVYDETVPDAVHVYTLAPLARAAEVLGCFRYREAAERALHYYKNQSDVFSAKLLTHFLGYIIDGFIEMGEEEFVRDQAQKVFRRQKKDGSISAYEKSPWVCSVGLAQLAIIGYKLGFPEHAERALGWLCSHQSKQGGFRGSYGRGASYFSKEEISWANKFFLDAVQYKIKYFFQQFAGIAPQDIAVSDARLRSVVAHVDGIGRGKILDAGCGKGRFSVRLQEQFPAAEIHGVDISEALLSAVPQSIITRRGSLLNLPYEDNEFDAVVCVEALEHALNPERAVKELCRVLRPGGKIIIIDKNSEKSGKLPIADFEQWFSREQISSLLATWCSDLNVTPTGYDGRAADGLFLVWTARKSEHALSPQQWHHALMRSESVQSCANRIRGNNFPVWVRPLLQTTAVGDFLLELGAGTGELSAILARYGRNTCLLDFAPESINFQRQLYHCLDLKGEFCCADVRAALPIRNSSVDWVWSSGLLEHFSDVDILNIVREATRISRNGVFSLVPNSQSLPYRIGKAQQERQGSWMYGRETPFLTLRPLYEAAGLRDISEFSVAPYQAIKFFRSCEHLAGQFYDGLSLAERQMMNQGYLLFTCGVK